MGTDVSYSVAFFTVNAKDTSSPLPRRVPAGTRFCGTSETEVLELDKLLRSITDTRKQKNQFNVFCATFL